MFAEELMLPAVPVQSMFLVVVAHPCVKVYTISSFEPLHCLSLGVGKMLKECVAPISGEKNQTTSSIECANEKEKSLLDIGCHL